MITRTKPLVRHPLDPVLDRLEQGGALLPDSPQNVMEVVGILKSYGVVLEAYYQNLLYIADHQFLELFPLFKYFNGQINLSKCLRHSWHRRINFEFAEYCMRAMMWHGGGGLDAYLDTPEFVQLARKAIQAKIRGNLVIQLVDPLFPDFLVEQVRLMVYYSALGQFWRVMSPMFLDLSDRYDHGEIHSIPDVVDHVLQGLVAAAGDPITYAVTLGGQTYDLIPASAELTFLKDTAVPYVEAVFFRSFPFMGTVSYNAQAHQISPDLERFSYGALYADPLPVGSAGIPPTLLMQDMRHYLPEYLHEQYRHSLRGEDDLRVQICQSFQKSMFCVTTAAILGLAPHPIQTADSQERADNRAYLTGWLNRLLPSRLLEVQDD